MNRQALLVLGMHRSGTSLLTGVLIQLGVRGPRTLMRPTDDNPLGFWESQPLFEFHDRLLRAARTSWDAWTPIGADWWDSEAAASSAAEFGSLLEREFGNAALFIVKDPRICRFVPLWVRNLEAIHVDPAAILTVRSPSEVALSLGTRNGLAREQSLLMWLRHVLDAEHDTRMIRRSIVRYRDLLGNWRGEIERIRADIGIELPSGSQAAAAVIDEFVRPELCHHSAGVETLGVDAPLSDWVTRTWQALDALAHDGMSAHGVIATLDEVRHQLDRAASQFGRWHEVERFALGERIAGLEAERNGLRDQNGRLETERDDLNRHTTRLEEDARTLLAQVGTLEVERADLGERVGDLERQRQQLACELAGARHHVDALLASVSWRITAPLRAVGRVVTRGRSAGPTSRGPSSEP